jgi:hypothetical protein
MAFQQELSDYRIRDERAQAARVQRLRIDAPLRPEYRYAREDGVFLT